MTQPLSAPTPRESDRPGDAPRYLSQLLAPFSQALDLVEGQPRGHALRTTAIAMRLAQRAGLSPEQQGYLYHATLLKDAGSSANASGLFHALGDDEIRIRPDLRTTGWPQTFREAVGLAVTSTADGTPLLSRLGTIVRLGLTSRIDSERLTRMRGDYGASVARKLRMPEPVVDALMHLEERWDGSGLPDRLQGEAIPIASRVIAVAQALEVYRNKPNADEAVERADDRSGSWFDPNLVAIAQSLHENGTLFAGLDDVLAGDLQNSVLLDRVIALEPPEVRIACSEVLVDAACPAFAWVIDAKSPFTVQRSRTVADVAMAMGRYFGMTAAEVNLLRRAALLRDVGMLGVPNVILEKPEPLTAQEFGIVMRHPQITLEILLQIPGFAEVAQIAASHHEALDGSGYLQGLGAKQIPFASRILAVADTFQALASERPYRQAFSRERILEILEEDVPSKLDPHCVEAIRGLIQSGALLRDDGIFLLSDSVECA